MLYDEEHFLGPLNQQSEKLKYDEEHFLGSTDNYLHTDIPKAPEEEGFLQRMLGRFAPDGTEPEEIVSQAGPPAQPEQPVSTEEPQPQSANPKGSELLKDIGSVAKGAAGELWNIGKSGVLMPAAGFAGIFGLAKGLDTSDKWIQNVSGFLDYKPKPGLEQTTAAVVSYPFQKLHELALSQGDRELKRYGSPLYAAAVATAYDLLPMILLHEKPEVTSRAIVRIGEELGEQELSRGEMARKSKKIFEEELAKQREEADLQREKWIQEQHVRGQESTADPTLIKSTEGAVTAPVLSEPEISTPPELVETVRRIRQNMAEHLMERVNQDQTKPPKETLSDPTMDTIVPLETTLPDFQNTNEVEAWAKEQKPTADLVAETLRLSDSYSEQAKQLRDKKLWDESIKAGTKAQMYREARENLLGTGGAKEDPIPQFDSELELKAQGVALDKRGFDKLSDANRLLEELHLESLQEYGEPVKDLDVVQIGDKFHVARGVEELLDLPPLEMEDTLLEEQAPLDELDREIEEAANIAEVPSEEKKAVAEQRLRELFSELAKESKIKEILNEDLEPRETLPGRGRPDIEPLEEADQNYWKDLLEAGGMKEELPLDSDRAGVSDEFELREDDYSKDLVDFMNDVLREPPSTRLGSGLGGIKGRKEKLRKYLTNIKFKEPEVLKDISKLHFDGHRYEVDLTYSKGNMWKDVPEELRPIHKFDYSPVTSDTVKANVAEHIPLPDNSVETAMFDPPFLLDRGGISKIVQRFSGMANTKALLSMHRNTLKEAMRVLKPGGKIVVKIQDTVYGRRQVWSSEELYVAAIKLGYRPVDKVYYVGRSFGMPPNTIKQRAFKKMVSTFYVFEKPKRSYRHIEGSLVNSGVGFPKEEGVNTIGIRKDEVQDIMLGSSLGGLQKFFSKGTPQNPFKSTAAKFDVEHPFKKAGWPDLGRAIKNRHSVKMVYEEEGLRTIKQLSDLELTPAEHGIAVILHENPKMQTPKLMKKYGKAVKIYDKFFNTWLKRYQERGGLENGFVENFINRQEKKLAAIDKVLSRSPEAKNIKPERLAKLREKRSQIKQAIQEVKSTKYTSTLSLWFEEMAKKDSGQMPKIFKIFAHRVREIPTLKRLYDAKLVTLEQLDGRKIVGHYTRRAAHDMAMLDIKNAGLKEGALARHRVKGKHMVPVDGQLFPMLKKHWIDPRLNEYLMTMASHWHKSGKLRQITMAIKGAQFINPLFLGGYDIIQGTMTGSLLSIHTPKNMLRALKEVYNFGDHYKRAFLDGAYSQPVNNPLEVWNDKVIKAMHPAHIRLFKALTSGGISWPIKNIYNASHAGAWAFDRVVRTISYLNLLDRGFSSLDAAQLAAKIHGDYASVPMELRQAAGMALYTPTFKITMGKLYYDMAKSTLKFALKPHEIIMSKDPKTGKWQRAKLTRQHAMAFGAAMFFGLSYARDKIMRMAGYQRERLGWRYFREVDTDEGPKEIVHSFGDPLAMPWKYFWRVYDAFRPGPKTAIDNLINSFRYEVSPFLQPIIFDLKDNLTPDGKPIYSMLAPKTVKLLKMGQYLTRRYVRLIDAVIPTEATEERRKLMDKEFGRFMSVLMSPIVFSYVRRTRGERAASKLQAAQRRLLWEIKKTRQPLSREQLKNYESMINSILEEGGVDGLD